MRELVYIFYRFSHAYHIYDECPLAYMSCFFFQVCLCLHIFLCINQRNKSTEPSVVLQPVAIKCDTKCKQMTFFNSFDSLGSSFQSCVFLFVCPMNKYVALSYIIMHNRLNRDRIQKIATSYHLPLIRSIHIR